MSPRLLSFVTKELKEILPPTLFFVIGFNLIVLTTNLLLADYLTAFGSFLLATTAALVVGKAVLVAKALRTIDFPAHVFDVAPNPALPATTSHNAQLDRSPVRSWQGGLLLGLVIVAAAILLWKTRAFWQQWITPFRSKHLVPLKPPNQPRMDANSLPTANGREWTRIEERLVQRYIDFLVVRMRLSVSA
jgi:hypothetical protein